MKKLAFIVLQIITLPFLISATWNTKNENLIIGNWKPSNGRSVVSIYKGVAANGEDATKFYGKIVWLIEPNDAKGKPRTDINNPDANKQKTPLKGLVIIKDLAFSKTEGNVIYWSGGTIYDPNNGSEYSFEADIDKTNSSLMNGSGYIGVSMFGRTDTWKKIVKK